MYDFDTVIDRMNSGSIKWDDAEACFGASGLLPMWIADTDFKASPAILKAMLQRVEHGVFGYNKLSASYFEAVQGWMERRHSCKIEKDWITFTPGVIPAVNLAIEAFSERGDEVLLPTPAYDPFFNCASRLDRVCVTVPMSNSEQGYRMDFEALQAAITDRTRLFILCSPHNPTGRVWTESELSQLADFCLRNNLIIIVDEIHNDIVFAKKHTMFLTLGGEIANRCAVITAPSKTFSTPGFPISNTIIQSPELRARFKAVVIRNNAHVSNSFAECIVKAAYNESEQWADEFTAYVRENHRYFAEYIEKHIPRLKVTGAEGTYLAWVDCSGLNMNAKQLAEFFNTKCKIGVNRGVAYGKPGETFMRFNLGCAKSRVAQALKQLEAAVSSL